MTTQIQIRSQRLAAIGVALLIATAACGTTKSPALAPGAAIDAPEANASAALAGAAYLTADSQYGVGLRMGGTPTQTNDAHVCTASGSTCIEP